MKSNKFKKIRNTYTTFDNNVTNTGAEILSIVKNSLAEGMEKANALYPLLFRVWLIIYAATTLRQKGRVK